MFQNKKKLNTIAINYNKYESKIDQMKNIILSIVTLAVLTVSCNQKTKETAVDNTVESKSTSELHACPMHPEITGEKGAECSECGMELTEKVLNGATIEKKDTVPVSEKIEVTTATTAAFTIDAIVSNYLKLKNALVNDDSKGAANAGKALFAAFDKVDSNTILDVKLKNKYKSIAENGKKNVKHISDHAGELWHQREYFALLSQDIFGLIKTFGTKQTVYQDYCPMYGEGKTGYWISETKDVINPYFGSEMLNCGRRIGVVK